MIRKRYLTLKLSLIEAEALLQLAGEADFATFESSGDTKRRQSNLFSAGHRAIDKLASAIAQHERPTIRAASSGS